MNHKDKKTERQFAVCISNKDCEDLEVRKIYEILPDSLAAEDGYIRVIDESEEDYLYPAIVFCRLSYRRQWKRLYRWQPETRSIAAILCSDSDRKNMIEITE